MAPAASSASLLADKMPHVRPSDLVYVVGLVKMPQLNGRLGLISSIRSDGRYVVALLESFQELGFDLPTKEMVAKNGKNVKRENLVLIEDSKCDANMFQMYGLCDGCKLPFFKKCLAKCSTCRRADYCSRECQSSAWKNGHKQHCAMLRNSRKDKTIDMASITGVENRVQARWTRSLQFAQKSDFAAAERELLCLTEEEQVKTSMLYGKLGFYARMQGSEERCFHYVTKGSELPIRTDSDKEDKLMCYLDRGELLLTLKRDREGSMAAFQAARELIPDHPLFEPKMADALKSSIFAS